MLIRLVGAMVHIDMDMFGQGYGTYRYGYVWSGLWYI